MNLRCCARAMRARSALLTTLLLVVSPHARSSAPQTARLGLLLAGDDQQTIGDSMSEVFSSGDPQASPLLVDSRRFGLNETSPSALLRLACRFVRERSLDGLVYADAGGRRDTAQLLDLLSAYTALPVVAVHGGGTAPLVRKVSAGKKNARSRDRLRGPCPSSYGVHFASLTRTIASPRTIRYR